MKRRAERGLPATFDDVAHNMAWWLEYKDFAKFVEDYTEIMEINGIEIPKVE